MKTFMTSDQHFDDASIIRFANRPFESIAKMNSFLISNWNAVVGKDDIVFNMGDFARTTPERIYELIYQLNGKIHLVMGNHEREINPMPEFWRELGFYEVYKYPIIYKDFYILSHEPVFLNKNMPYANFHGHLHSIEYNFKQYYNVSVELRNYKPVEFYEIVKHIIEK